MKKVVLDAGHGKETPGKRAFDNSLYEWQFNRNVAGMVKTHLERHGVQVELTAAGDNDVSLEQRCRISNNLKPDCFVSIHANAFGTTWNDANGWEIYVVGRGGKAEQLAESIRKHSKQLGLKDRGLKVSDFYVLKKTDAPAVLIEHGFYTNKAELTKLKTPAFQQQCAEADARGIIEHLGLVWKDEQFQKPIQDEISNWAKAAHEWVQQAGISDGSRAKEQVTREEVWLMLYNMNK